MAEQQKKIPPSFTELSLPHREMPSLLESRYRVYRGPKDYVVVEANSALEALKASGLAQATRIERDAIFFQNLLKIDSLQPPPGPEAFTPPASPQNTVPQPIAPQNTAPQDTAPPAPPAPAEQAAPVTPPPAAAVEKPLSTAEVDKLLQG